MSSPSNIAETKNKEHLFPYKRVLLKLSGEVFGSSGIDYANIAKISEQILLFHKHSIELAVVIGGGNILRGEEAAKYGMERATADYMGMLATASLARRWNCTFSISKQRIMLRHLRINLCCRNRQSLFHDRHNCCSRNYCKGHQG